MNPLHNARVWQLILLVSPAFILSHGQSCKDFSLHAESSSQTAEIGKPISVQITLANHSLGTVTVYVRHMPTSWAIYEQYGSRWPHVWSGGLSRGVGSADAQNDSQPVSAKFPPEDYVEVSPGEVITKKLDFDVWGSNDRPIKYMGSKIRIFFKYAVEPRGAEAQLNMLQCHLRSGPVEINLASTKNVHKRRADR